MLSSSSKRVWPYLSCCTCWGRQNVSTIHCWKSSTTRYGQLLLQYWTWISATEMQDSEYGVRWCRHIRLFGISCIYTPAPTICPFTQHFSTSRSICWRHWSTVDRTSQLANTGSGSAAHPEGMGQAGCNQSPRPDLLQRLLPHKVTAVIGFMYDRSPQLVWDTRMRPSG